MLNVISQSLGSKKVRGPKKVAENLIKGLDIIRYPYMINRGLDSCPLLWIHDDIRALKHISKLSNNTKIIIGPNLFINPSDIPKNLDLSRVVYIHPSTIVTDGWKARGYLKSTLDVWPVGIDTDIHTPSKEIRNQVLIYFKHRTEKELNLIKEVMKSKKISYMIVSYGSYTEAAYINILKKTQYIVWLGGYESQGIALEEALASDIPILVIDRENPVTKFDTNSTAAPYFDSRCGEKICGGSESSRDTIAQAVDRMEQMWSILHPRVFILENLSLQKQAEKFIALYEKHFDLSVTTTKHELPYNSVIWKPASFIEKIFAKIYRIIKL
jgi:hypothetical protein